MARTKSREGEGTDVPFDQRGKTFALTFNPYQESLWEVQQVVVWLVWVLVTMLYDLNPYLSAYISRTAT